MHAKSTTHLLRNIPNGPMDAVGLAYNFAVMGDAIPAVQWMERAYAAEGISRCSRFPFDRSIPQAVLADPGWKALMQKPLFRDWQAAHDRLAVELGMRSELSVGRTRKSCSITGLHIAVAHQRQFPVLAEIAVRPTRVRNGLGGTP